VLQIQKLMNVPKFADTSFELASPITPNPSNQDYRKLRGWAKAQYPEPEIVDVSDANVDMKSES
jgi:hypothetical protein